MQKLQPQKEIVVDDRKYVIQLYSPTFGFTLWAKLVRLLGEPIIKLVDMFPKGKDVKSLLSIDFADLNTEAAGEAIASLFGSLKDEEFVPLIKEILSGTFTSPGLDPVSGIFETEFAGQYLHVFKLVAKTLGAQYPDFLSGIAKRRNVGKSDSASVAPMKKERAGA